jgi:ABC-type antimicrobial peptide transport system permease subunit
MDDENIVPGPSMNVYQPFGQDSLFFGRLFVHSHSDPYALVQPIRRVIHDLSAEQPVERPATLADIRAEVLAPDRLNTFVFGGFAAVALAIAVVGVAGVLAFHVSGRMREFGIRLAIGSEPRHLLQSVLEQGAVIAIGGILVGAAGGYALARLAGSYFDTMQIPGPVVLIGSATVLLAAAMVASVLPALRTKIRVSSVLLVRFGRRRGAGSRVAVRSFED